jgi:hypothetical protein
MLPQAGEAVSPVTKRVYDNSFLDKMRLIGDPAADRAVEEIYRTGRLAAVQSLLDHLVVNDAVVPAALPPAIRTFWNQSKEFARSQAARIEKGEAFFADHGPEIVMVLGFYSLPEDYAARGVRVLFETGELSHRPNRRVFETLQMVIDVMSPGGLAAEGRGIATALKVRLMHATVRTLLLHGYEIHNLPPSLGQWDFSLGRPLNQEDMAGTLMSFSVLVIEGLEKLGIRANADKAEAYLDAWRVVARILGIQPELIPENLEEARRLKEIIGDRQIAPGAMSRSMTQSLLAFYQERIPWRLLKGIPAALMRLFLVEEIADGLGIPRARFWTLVIQILAPLSALADRVLSTGTNRWLCRRLTIRMIQHLIDVSRGGDRPLFQLPRTLDQAWRISEYGRDSIWNRAMRSLRLTR